MSMFITTPCVFLRLCDRSGAVCGHRRLQAVARTDRNELPGLLRKEFRDGARVVSPDGNAGEDERAGVYLLAPEPGGTVLRVDKGSQGGGVYRRPRHPHRA